jgi:hypothetical protein
MGKGNCLCVCVCWGIGGRGGGKGDAFEAKPTPQPLSCWLSHARHLLPVPRDGPPPLARLPLQTERAYRAGEQVRISYAPKTSGELLLSYGFLPEEGANPHDACLLVCELGSGDGEAAWKRAALTRRGLGARQSFPLRMGAVPRGLLEFAALACGECGSEEEVERRCELLFSGEGGGGGEGVLEGGERCAALQWVVKRCQVALSGYAASMEDNKAELEELLGGVNGRERARGEEEARRADVLRVIIFEQKVLNRTAFLLTQQIRQLKARR